MEKLFTDLEVNGYDTAHHYEDRLDATACAYTAKGYAIGKKHLIEDLKEELNRRLDLFTGDKGDPEVMKRVEGVIKAYKSILEWLDNESNGISKENN